MNDERPPYPYRPPRWAFWRRGAWREYRERKVAWDAYFETHPSITITRWEYAAFSIDSQIN